MSSFFMFLLLAAITCLIWGLISPSHLTKTARINRAISRKHISFGGLGVIIALIILVSITAPNSQPLISTRTTARTQSTPTAAVTPKPATPITTTKQVSQTVSINFATTNENDATLAKGQKQVSQVGQDGVETDVYSITETDGKLVSKTLVSKSITTAPINQIMQVGTYVAPPTPRPTPEPIPQATPSASQSMPTPTTCTPLTNGGNCYEPGEYCRDSDHGVSGVAGDGESITCLDNNGWRWEPS